MPTPPLPSRASPGLVRTPGGCTSWLRLAACMAVLGVLGACSSGRPGVVRDTAEYAARAKGNYTPPGPPGDPWGPYISKAATRFDVPERWVREVMRAESGGQLYHGGRLVTSSAGAMGLMQVMPGTYEELRARHGLDDDPFDPHDNILAGTAYIREMYDLYGSPGFLAAYNAGPRRFEDYAIRNRGLPNETRRYVAKIAPNIADHVPQNQSDAAMLAMYQIPSDIPVGPRYPRGRGAPPVALAQIQTPTGPTRGSERGTVLAVNLPTPASITPAFSRLAPPVAVAMLAPPPVPPQQARRGFSLIAPAMAGSLPMAGSVPIRPSGSATGPWAIQVGAFANEGLARAAAEAARGQMRDVLGGARSAVGGVRQGGGMLYRARLAGLSREAAMQACEKLSRGRSACIVLSPDAQS